MSVALELWDVTVVRQNQLGLDGVSAHIEAGEFVGVIGPNGAGKTTLLTALNGMSPLTRGSVRVGGQDPHGWRGHRVRANIGYVPQLRRPDPRLPITVRESVLTGRLGQLGWLKRPGREDWSKVDEALDQVGMSDLAARPLGQLSGGEYQRAAIARVLVQEPSVYLFDEPASSIDPQAQHDVVALVHSLHRETGATVLYVTHDLPALPLAARRLLLLKNGRLWRDGPREALLEPREIRALYGFEAGVYPFGEGEDDRDEGTVLRSRAAR